MITLRHDFRSDAYGFFAIISPRCFASHAYAAHEYAQARYTPLSRYAFHAALVAIYAMPLDFPEAYLAYALALLLCCYDASRHYAFRRRHTSLRRPR